MFLSNHYAFMLIGKIAVVDADRNSHGIGRNLYYRVDNTGIGTVDTFGADYAHTIGKGC